MAGKQESPAQDHRTLFEISISEEIERVSEALSSGRCKDFSEYRSLTGRIEGLRFSLDEFKDLQKRAIDG